MNRRPTRLLVLLLACSRSARADDEPIDAAWIEAHYEKREEMVPMRDGTRLFTAIYRPRAPTAPVPILMTRTPYSCRPYGVDAWRKSLGPNAALARDGYVFVYQDVRGTHLSEGTFVNMRPHRSQKQAGDVDESTDTHDTIEWLLANVEGTNGRVGTWGISYPGFYAAAGMIDAHPALAAVSPQAPIADWYFDDFHHHGALFLPHAFNFLASFGLPRPEPTQESHPRFDHGTPDGYRFFLDLGPLGNADRLHLEGKVAFWSDLMQHPDYDAFWRERNLLPHLNRVAPAVLVVGGWFDAEDLYGPLQIYQSVERRNPDVFNALVMGPWAHGGWSRSDGDHLGNVHFGGPQSHFYRDEVERPFFDHFLRGGPAPGIAEATVFETGANRWRRFDQWPPEGVLPRRLHLRDDGRVAFEPPPPSSTGCFEFVSDPARPVPYTEEITTGMTRAYMTDDQRFAGRRPDVLTWRGEPLAAAVTLAGPLAAALTVSTSADDADWVVKLIDEFPPDQTAPEGFAPTRPHGGYQMMVRSEVFRGRYRNGYDRPEPFVPGAPTRVDVPLQDVLHTFRAGHRIVVQVQSTWFPLVDRNPQRWVKNVFAAEEHDFVKAVHRVHLGGAGGSALEVLVLPSSDE